MGLPIETDGFSIPEWTDIDCDDDGDLFLGRLNGRITLYENIGLSPGNLPRFTFVTDTFQGIDIQTGGGAKKKAPLIRFHGANSLTFVDIDADQDNDLFWGDFFASSLIHLENYGNCIMALFVPDSIVENYPPGQPLNSAGYNVPHFYDLDNDSDLDLFAGILGGAVSLTGNITENFYFYRNTGNSAQANFTLESRQFIKHIDVGQNSIPALVDIDNDGDEDLFLANQEDLNSPESSNSRLYFFENRGNTSHPEFYLQNNHYLNYDKRFDVNYAPVFVDIDDDGDYDLFLGKFDGKLSFWQNDGNAISADFVLTSENYSGIDIGSNSLPAFVDIDADLDQDLFIGEFNGNINFYRNIGSPTSANFQLDTTNYSGINIGQSEFSYPHFNDIDRDGDFDLFVGSATRGTFFYRNTGSPQNASFTPDNSLQIPVLLRNTPCLVDLDDDGDDDLLMGIYGGGLVYYENQEFVGIERSTKSTAIDTDRIKLLGNYPNPFNPTTVISWRLAVSSQVNLSVYNLRGQKIKTLLSAFLLSGIHSVEWNAQNSASGIYFYKLEAEGLSKTGKMILMK
jgi:hypothetical protein